MEVGLREVAHAQTEIGVAAQQTGDVHGDAAAQTGRYAPEVDGAAEVAGDIGVFDDVGSAEIQIEIHARADNMEFIQMECGAVYVAAVEIHLELSGKFAETERLVLSPAVGNVKSGFERGENGVGEHPGAGELHGGRQLHVGFQRFGQGTHLRRQMFQRLLDGNGVDAAGEAGHRRVAREVERGGEVKPVVVEGEMHVVGFHGQRGVVVPAQSAVETESKFREPELAEEREPHVAPERDAIAGRVGSVARHIA